MNTFEEKYQQIYNAYLEQDYKNNIFDVIFYVDGKELYAHGHILGTASDVFKEQILQNRSNGNGPIQIDNFTYDEFYEFIRLLYCFDDSRKNKFDKTKIYAIIELAHVYKHDKLIEDAGDQLAYCGGFKRFSYVEDFDDIFEKFEFAHKYSLEYFTEAVLNNNYLGKYFNYLIGYNGFVNLDKNVLKTFVEFVLNPDHYCHYDIDREEKFNINREEKLCKAIYKWGKHQAMITVEMPKEEKKELVLHYIKDFIPLFDFEYMSNKFLFKFAVPRGLISIDEANIYGRIEVSITCNDETTISGTFVDCYGIFEVIGSREDEDENDLVDCGEKKRCFWDNIFKVPSTPSTVEKMKGCDWYLAFDRHGKLNLKHQSIIKRRDYLIAEMKASNENDAAFALGKDSYAFANAGRT